MNEPTPQNLTEGWPDDPQNEELARFATELQAALPALPPESLARVEQSIQAELKRRHARWRRWTRLAAAAAVLLALGVGGFLWMRSTPEQRAEAPVEDRYRVELAAPVVPLPPQPPLVRLEEHKSLFAD
ncbi:MAG: hypothetical protein L0Z62_20815 [Gemmataceae bacterium]|nr:hypothetical protein [Gemmataceae bacterium]